MNGLVFVILGLGAPLLMLGLVIWLKGTLSFVRELSRSTWERRGEQWVQYALLEPFLFPPFAFVAAAFRLAHPESRWARWFYSDRRRIAARNRYPSADIAKNGQNNRIDVREVIG